MTLEVFLEPNERLSDLARVVRVVVEAFEHDTEKRVLGVRSTVSLVLCMEVVEFRDVESELFTMLFDCFRHSGVIENLDVVVDTGSQRRHELFFGSKQLMVDLAEMYCFLFRYHDTFDGSSKVCCLSCLLPPSHRLRLLLSRSREAAVHSFFYIEKPHPKRLFRLGMSEEEPQKHCRHRSNIWFCENKKKKNIIRNVPI